MVLFCGIFLSISAAVTFDSGEASARSRSLKLYFTHTRESATITFKRNGRYVRSGLNKLNRFLRDWRRNEPTKMDPRLFDLVWEVYKRSGSRKPIHVVSGYRSPKTNATLRRRGRGVASKSQHIRGRALDFFLPDVSVKKLRALGLKAHAGGVGYYPGSFVHLDTGSVRHWPRMSRSQLARVFPRGRTLHVPRDGKPMSGYQYARAKYKRRGRKGPILIASASSTSRSKKSGLLKRIFSRDEDTGPTKTNLRKVVKKPAKPKTGPDKNKNNQLPGVTLASAPQKKEAKEAEVVVAATQPPLPKRIVVPKLRPGSKPAGTLVATLEQSPQVLADRFATGSVVSPSRRPVMKVEESRFALVATPEPTVTQRAAEALARSRSIPSARPTVALESSRKQAPVEDKIQLALLGSARSVELASPVQQALSAPTVTNIQNTGKPALPSVIPVTAPRKAASPDNVSRIDAAFAALAPVKKSTISAPKSRPLRIASLEPAHTTPQARPVDMFGVRQQAVSPRKSARPAVKADVSKIGQFAYSMQLGNLDGQQVTMWALSRSTRIGALASLTAPRYIGVLKLEPTIVLDDHFSKTGKINRTNRFSGQAIKRLAFAKFVTKELPKTGLVIAGRF